MSCYNGSLRPKLFENGLANRKRVANAGLTNLENLLGDKFGNRVRSVS